MKKQLISFLLTCALLAVSLASNARVYYVANPGVGNGNNSGDSWRNAAPDIQFVLTSTNYFPLNLSSNVPYIQDNDTIFVAVGEYDRVCVHYKGYMSNGALTDSCGIRNLYIYGGFKGFETSLSQRTNWRYYETTINAQGGRAVWFEGWQNPNQNTPTPSNIVFDGFTVTGAGAGLEAFRIVFTNALISHVIIKNNYGIPIYIESTPTPNNTGTEVFPATTFADVAIFNNKATGWSSSVLCAQSSYIDFVNTTIRKNSTNASSPKIFAFYSNHSYVGIYNSIIYDNYGGDDFANFSFAPSKVTMDKSIIEYCVTPSTEWVQPYHTNLGAFDTNPQLISDYQLASTSPAIAQGDPDFLNLYWQNFIASWAYNNKDIDGRPRFSSLYTIDLGAWQYDDSGYKEELRPHKNNTGLIQENRSLVSQYNDCIIIENLSANDVVSLYNIHGVKLHTSQSNGQGFINIQKPSMPGVYVLVISNWESVTSQKIIVSK